MHHVCIYMYIHTQVFKADHSGVSLSLSLSLSLSRNTHCSVLEAVCRLLSKYPTNKLIFCDSCRAVLALKNSLPLEISHVIRDVQQKVLEAVSKFVLHQENMGVVDFTLNLLILLWNRYPKQLPKECDIEHLSCMLTAALNVESHGEKMAAVQVGQDFVSFMMRLLNDKQLQELQSNGVGRKLCSLLSYHEDMNSGILQQLVVGVGMLAEVKLNVQELIADNIHVALLFAAQKHFSHAVIQELIWRLFSLLIQKDISFIKELDSSGLLPAISSIMQQEGFVLMPLVRFLTLCCHRAPNPFLRLLLEHEELMHALLKVIQTDTKHSLESVTHTCDFLAYMCSKVSPRHIGKVFDLGVVSQIKACAQKWPEACLLQACLAIEGLCAPFPQDMLDTETMKKREEFFGQDHHVFAKDMLCEPVVSQNNSLLELLYVLFQKLLRASPPSTLQRMCDREFVEALVMLFARDTFSSLPQQANRIAFTMHYFVFQMKHKECFEHLRDLCFHTFVVDLIQSSNSYDVTATAMGLLASLLGKYYNHFKNVSVILDTQLPELVITKCVQYRTRQTPQFGDDFGRLLLNLTADKDMSLQLHKRGYMDKLLDVLKEEGYAPVIRRSVIHAVGNISLGSQTIKQELQEREFHETLLCTLERESDNGDAFLLCACCRVLHILASGDGAKRKFVERGCIPLVLHLLRNRRNDTKLHSEELAWRSLSLLGSLGFIAVTNRRNVLTPRVIDEISEILQNSKNGKVISYIVLIFLGAGELDEAAVRLRECQVDEHLIKAMENEVYKVQAPDLARWCSHVLEKEYLYTIMVPFNSHHISPPPLSPSTARQIDWPHHLVESDTNMETEGVGIDEQKLLPLEEEFMVSQCPVAPHLSPTAKQQLRELGLDPEQPLFRLGRVYGSTHGFCSNCDRENISEELVIRPHSLTPHQYQDLIDNGWYRRGGVKLFRLRCNHNVYHADWETHVNALKFDRNSHKSYGRVLKRMPKDRLTVETLPTHFNREAFDLYNAYHIEKHDKPLKSMFSYAEHVVNSPVQSQTVDGIEYGTFHQLYRLDGNLVAIGIIDVVPKGIVSIYMWYDVTKAVSKYSFGVYSALKEIELVCNYHERNPNMQNYYLQGWNKLNKKLAYKSNYDPGYFYCPTIVGGWVEGEEGVEKSQEAYIQRKRDQKTEEDGNEVVDTREDSSGNDGCKKNSVSNKPQGIKGEDGNLCCNNHNHETQQEDMDTTDSGHTEKKPTGTDGSLESNCNNVKDESSTSTPVSDSCSCEAYPIDLARYTARTGENTVDIRNIVVCLNYTEYRRLGEVIDQYHIPESQKNIMEQRLSELIVTLTPRLLAQLVIDIKVCSRPQGSSESAVLLESRRTTDTEALAV